MPDKDMLGNLTNRRRILQSFGAAGAAGLAGCFGGDGGDGDDGGDGTDGGDGGDGTPTGTEESTPFQEYQEGGELIASIGADVKNFDPVQINDTTSSKVFNVVYEGVMRVDFQGRPQPYLAESVEIEGDTNVTITLREGVTFHDHDALDDNTVTAEDVLATFERYQGTPREADVADWYEFGSGNAVDDRTLELQLKRPYAPLKFSIGVPIVPKEVADGDIDLAEEPVGTGPYRFEEHQPDSLFRISKNENYWAAETDAFSDVGENFPQSGVLDTVTFRVINEQSAQLAALQGGDIQLANSPPAGSISDLKNNDEFRVTERTAGGFDMFVYPMHQEAGTPFQNKKVRHGVNRLIPREAIVENVYDGIGQPAYAPVSPLAAQFTSEEFQQEMGDEYARYDQEQAQQLLDEGFNEAGFDRPWETEIIVNQNPQREQWVQLIQESMNQTEFFDVSVNVFEWNTYVGKILAEDSHTVNQITAVGWSAGWDPDNYMRNLFHSDQHTPQCCNINHYSNEEVDQMLDDGVSTYDIDERAQLYDELQRTIVDESPMAFIRFGMEMDAVADATVKGWSTYPINGGEYYGIYAPYAGKFTWINQDQ